MPYLPERGSALIYKCLDCGREFDTPAQHKENRGEFWGAPCYETILVCPYCYGDFEEKKDGEEDECETD